MPASFDVGTMYKNRRPSGKNVGAAPRDSSWISISWLGTPPPADTRLSPEAVPNTITPSGFQVPPKWTGASQRVCAGPPPTEIFFSLPPAKNPIYRLSGDQKGYAAPSVPGRGCAVALSNGRNQSCGAPPPDATN